MPVVTVSSQYGAGAREVGRLIAENLRLQYVDQAVLVDAARQLGVNVKRVAAHDERTDSFRERLGHFLQRALERSAAGGNVDPLMGAGNLELMLAQSYQDVTDAAAPQVINDRAYLDAITHIMIELAQRGDMVLIGRGSQMILRDHDDTVHVQLVADEQVRLGRVKEWQDIDDDEAASKYMRRFNRSRAAFHKKFWKVDVWDPRLYDVVINTTDVSYETAAEMVALTVKARLGAALSASR